jgi:hypothetical protein
MATSTKSKSSKSTSTKSSSKSSSSHSTPHALSTDQRNRMSDSTYAFPEQRKEPLNNASHVRNAIARFDQVKDVSDADRSKAFGRIRKAAKKFGVDMPETSASQLGNHPHTSNSTR